MANRKPMIETLKAEAAIAKGTAMKAGADRDHAAQATANTDRAFGLAQGVTLLAEELLEIAGFGGGAQALLGETVADGDYLVPGAGGKLFKPNAEGDALIAIAREGGVLDDLISVDIISGTAHAAI